MKIHRSHEVTELSALSGRPRPRLAGHVNNGRTPLPSWGSQFRSWWFIRLCGEAEFESGEVTGSVPVQGCAVPVGVQAQEVEGDGHEGVVEAVFREAAVAGAPGGVADGLVHGALDALLASESARNPAAGLGGAGGRTPAGRGGGWSAADVSGPAAGAQLAGWAGAAVGRGRTSPRSRSCLPGVHGDQEEDAFPCGQVTAFAS